MQKKKENLIPCSRFSFQLFELKLCWCLVTFSYSAFFSLLMVISLLVSYVFIVVSVIISEVLVKYYTRIMLHKLDTYKYKIICIFTYTVSCIELKSFPVTVAFVVRYNNFEFYIMSSYFNQRNSLKNETFETMYRMKVCQV